MEYHHIHYSPNNKLFSLEAVFFSHQGKKSCHIILWGRTTGICLDQSRRKEGVVEKSVKIYIWIWLQALYVLAVWPAVWRWVPFVGPISILRERGKLSSVLWSASKRTCAITRGLALLSQSCGPLAGKALRRVSTPRLFRSRLPFYLDPEDTCCRLVPVSCKWRVQRLSKCRFATVEKD